MRVRIVLLAVAVALLQIGTHALGSDWVVPNLPLIFVIWNAPKYPLMSMTALIVVMGVILEVASLMPAGLDIIGLFLVLLVSKYVIHDGRQASKWTFQFVLLAAATILTNIFAYATMPTGTIAQDIGYATLRIGLELLYNCSILLIAVALSDRTTGRDQRYHLPGSK